MEIYLYLAKGLNYVEAVPGNREDLMFDAQNFIRKLSWKMYFKLKASESAQPIENEDMHAHMLTNRNRYPDFNHPLLDQIKTKIMGWVSNVELKKPTANLNGNELKGSKLLLELINGERVFITKADKGGATLIINYDTVVYTILQEIENSCKYIKLEEPVEKRM